MKLAINLSLSLPILGFVMLVSLCAAPAEPYKHQSNDGSQTFNGVSAKFALENPNLRRNETLRIRLALRNSSDQTVDFAYTATILHIRVYDAAKKEIDQRMGAPILEAAAFPIHLAPSENYETILSVDLWTYYELIPGKYYLRFYYDLRLLNEKTLTDHYRKLYHSSPLLLWDARYYPFRVTR
jgi:hypothetical protein